MANVPLTERQLWLQVVQKCGAVLVISFLIWLLSLVFLDEPLHHIVAMILLLGGMATGVFDNSRFPTRQPRLLKGGITAFFFALAVWNWLPPRPEADMEWQPYSVAALENAAREGRPVIIDFYADWCPPCRELDQRVFSRKIVVDEAQRFVRLRADLTDQNSPVNAAISERHAVMAFPTVALIGSDGRERTSMRLLGYEPASRFVARLKAIP
ncbi:MAG TPA: hypothetical protein DCY13_12795 [Verrucomicrobiales bacterium]|nr:hypothetical protein [Verrucomicrobiales bacterium]